MKPVNILAEFCPFSWILQNWSMSCVRIPYAYVCIHLCCCIQTLVDTLFDLGLCNVHLSIVARWVVYAELSALNYPALNCLRWIILRWIVASPHFIWFCAGHLHITWKQDMCRHYGVEKAVCPPQLKGGLLTTAAADNIDHNPNNLLVYMTWSTEVGSPSSTSRRHFHWGSAECCYHSSQHSKRSQEKGSSTARHINQCAPCCYNFRQDPLYQRLRDPTRVRVIDTDKQIISTHHAEVLSIWPRYIYISGCAPCTREEGDTHILLHLEDEGYTKVSIYAHLIRKC